MGTVCIGSVGEVGEVVFGETLIPTLIAVPTKDGDDVDNVTSLEELVGEAELLEELEDEVRDEMELELASLEMYCATEEAVKTTEGTMVVSPVALAEFWLGRPDIACTYGELVVLVTVVESFAKRPCQEDEEDNSTEVLV